LSQGRSQTVQTIISWQTDEPAVCQVLYEKGSTNKEDLPEKTQPETGYGRKHVSVLNKFEPGQVYSFRVLCADSESNQLVSGAHTILTPKQNEGVFELIMRNMVSTFGWLRDVR
jgi:hypothetical protein